MKKKATRRRLPEGRAKRKPPIPRPSQASPASLHRLKVLERYVAKLETRLAAEITRAAQEQQRHDTESLQRTSETLRAIYQRITQVEKKQNEIDGREARLSGAIEQAVQASQVLRRVEIGLRPMLVKALENDKAAHWMENALDDAVHRLYAGRSPA